MSDLDLPDHAPTSAPPTTGDAAAMAAALDAHPDFEVLERLVHRPVIADAGGEPEGRGLVVDVETTGRDTGRDQIIQLAAIPFRFTQDTGRVTSVSDAVTEFEDPGRSIPAEVVALTGITDDDVRGTRLNDDRFAALAAETDVIIAHNARFDRPFIERRLAAFRPCAWACSWSEVPWLMQAGVNSASLEFLLYKVCRRFFGAHRADEDCLAVIELLARDLHDGRPAMRHLLDASTRESVRVRAISAAFEAKDLLKARGYRWWPGDADSVKCWHTEIPAAEVEAERTWLSEHAYPPGRCRAQFEPITATTRFRPLGA